MLQRISCSRSNLDSPIGGNLLQYERTNQDRRPESYLFFIYFIQGYHSCQCDLNASPSTRLNSMR